MNWLATYVTQMVTFFITLAASNLDGILAIGLSFMVALLSYPLWTEALKKTTTDGNQ